MIRILLVEDSPADAEFTREMLADCGIEHSLDHATDGEEAWEVLQNEPYDLLLLDLNLPRLTGTELLARMREHAKHDDLAVVVLATSDAERDILATERLHADGYIAKPVDPDELKFHIYRAMRGRDSG